MTRGAAQRPSILSREALASGAIRRMIRVHSPHVEMLTPAALAASRRAALAGHDLTGGVWLFAYGSLMWNPLIEVAERRLGTAFGYHRRLCIWTDLGRGSPSRPGLMLALDRGGACRGLLLRVAPERLESELDLIWQREMLTSIYRVRWLRVRSETGPVYAIALAQFVICMHCDRIVSGFPLGSERWITSAFGSGFRVSTS